MLSAIKDLGELVIHREEKDDLDIFVEDPNATGNYTQVITINIEQNGETLRFVGVELEDYDSQKKMRYLYRRGSANGPDLSPTAKISGKPAGTFERKILGWFRILEDTDISLEERDKVFLEDIQTILTENADGIKERIVNFRESIPKKEGLLVTLKIYHEGKSKYVGDFPVIIDLFLKQIRKKDERFAVQQQVCSLCGNKKETILGNINTYAFYTIDKPGYIIGNFDKKKAWRNFPVCADCKLNLEEGKKHVEQNLNFRFCGIKYNLVPKFIIGYEGISSEVIDIFTNTSKLISLKQKRIESITGDEEDILTELKDIQDTVTLNFLFIQKMNAAERIHLVIEDVFPSRLRKIFASKYYTDNIYARSFTFRTLRSFFFKSDKNKRNTDLDKYFLDIIDRVFKGRPVSYHFILKFIMMKIRGEFVNDGYFNFAVTDGLMTIAFLKKLELFEMEVEKMEERVFSEMFAKYGPTFETPLKRGLFLLGSLTEMLLRKQYSEREAKPFINNLKSLKMNERDFKGLLPKVQNKLEEYNSFDKGKRLIAKEAANYLLVSGSNWRMSVDEMNFYFAAGMNLIEEVANIVYPDKKAMEESL